MTITSAHRSNFKLPSARIASDAARRAQLSGLSLGNLIPIKRAGEFRPR
jgi:hypothetical protein